MATADGAWPRVRNFVAGYGSGVALVLAGHPFDTIKVRLQTEGVGGKFGGPLACLAETLSKEGVLAVYKGAAAPMLMTGVINSLLFGFQGLAVRAIAADPSSPKVQEVCLAAVAGGAAISTIVAPMEGVKARLQVQYSAASAGTGAGAAHYAGPMHCARSVVSKLGVAQGLYRGWLPTCLCRMSNWAYFGSYEYIARGVGQRVDGEGAAKRSFATTVLSGGLAGVCYWLSCYPIDVVKNRIQAAPDTIPPQYASTSDAFRKIYRTEGVRGFFVGFTPCALRAVPANAAAFTAFETIMQLLPERLGGEEQ